MAITSRARETGCPWKLPPETMSPASAKTSGLSVAALASRARTPREKARPSRAAPCTCGMQRSEYGSCTRWQSGPWWEEFRGESASSSRRWAAASAWPSCPRASWMDARNGRWEPSNPSSVMAPATSDMAASRSARTWASEPTATMAWVPFTRASPSLACSTAGRRPTRASASRPGRRWPATQASPSPMTTSARWARGARSPEAPTEPRSGTTGMQSRSRRARTSSSVSSRMPLRPLASTLARRSTRARASAGDSGAPTPAAWERTRLRWSLSRSPRAIRTSASVPKPVLIP